MNEPTDARVGALCALGAFGIWGLVPIYFKAVAGVGIQLMMLGALPWVSLVLAFSFGFYGLLRKRLPLGALNGLFAETVIAAASV